MSGRADHAGAEIQGCWPTPRRENFAAPKRPKAGKSASFIAWPLHLPSHAPIRLGTNLMRDSEFEFIRTLVYEHSRIKLGPDKRELVSARLGKRLRATNLDSIGEYCSFLQGPSSDDELAHLIDAISTNHTFFFRE